MGGAGSVLKSLHVDTIMMASRTMVNHEVNTVLQDKEEKQGGRYAGFSLMEEKRL